MQETLETAAKADPAFRADVLRGLAEPVPAIPARWLYDRRGSELFDEITRLPAYYPTRTETALLEQVMVDLPDYVAPGGAEQGGRVDGRAQGTVPAPAGRGERTDLRTAPPAEPWSGTRDCAASAASVAISRPRFIGPGWRMTVCS